MPASGTEKVPGIDDRIAEVRFNHPAGGATTRGIDLGAALRMAQHGGSVDVYLSDHEAWFELVRGPSWRIDTLIAVIRQSVLSEVKEGLPHDKTAGHLNSIATLLEGMRTGAGGLPIDTKRDVDFLRDLAAFLATITPEEETITVEGSILGRPVRNSSGIGEYHGLFSPDACGEACAAAESGPGAEYETYLPASVAEELAEAAERALVACAEGTVTGAEEAQQHLEDALTRYQATKETTDAH